MLAVTPLLIIMTRTPVGPPVLPPSTASVLMPVPVIVTLCVSVSVNPLSSLIVCGPLRSVKTIASGVPPNCVA